MTRSKVVHYYWVGEHFATVACGQNNVMAITRKRSEVTCALCRRTARFKNDMAVARGR